ncbi:MAG TPA: YceI family protein [Ohtaekwangia sp.]|uniref:YceI family protein n=1 Tax=Ohtaekwangia sp. TaxID=2066019 RepID=UPI002F950F07
MENKTWIIDNAHSEVQFKVKHLVISTVTGSFTKFNGIVDATENFENVKISFEADIDSISTHNEQRDEHLKSPEFFDAGTFPKLKFTSTKFTKTGDDYELEGDLSIKDVSRKVKLTVDHSGIAKDPWGNVKAGFEVSGKINRKDFGLTWSALTETGGAVVSDEVKLIANIQLLKQ